MKTQPKDEKDATADHAHVLVLSDIPLPTLGVTEEIAGVKKYMRTDNLTQQERLEALRAVTKAAEAYAKEGHPPTILFTENMSEEWIVLLEWHNNQSLLSPEIPRVNLVYPLVNLASLPEIDAGTFTSPTMLSMLSTAYPIPKTPTQGITSLNPVPIRLEFDDQYRADRMSIMEDLRVDSETGEVRTPSAPEVETAKAQIVRLACERAKTLLSPYLSIYSRNTQYAISGAPALVRCAINLLRPHSNPKIIVHSGQKAKN